MTDTTSALRHRLIRNFDEVSKQHETRAPLHDTWCARLAAGTEARALGISIDRQSAGRPTRLLGR